MSIFHNKKRVQHRRSNKPRSLSNVYGTINSGPRRLQPETRVFSFILQFSLRLRYQTIPLWETTFLSSLASPVVDVSPTNMKLKLHRSKHSYFESFQVMQHSSQAIVFATVALCSADSSSSYEEQINIIEHSPFRKLKFHMHYYTQNHKSPSMSNDRPQRSCSQPSAPPHGPP